MKLQPVIKWTGSKRSQSEYIISKFPEKIKTYYEPFVGGASVLFRLLHSNIKVNNYVCSDANNDLILLWNKIKYHPKELIDGYTESWNKLNVDNDIERRKNYFYYIRKRFNEYKQPSDFLFLSRTCTNGLIRYNNKGEFNTSLHFSRNGIVPETLRDIIIKWNQKLNEHNVSFLCQDYKDITPTYSDLIYLDPPYANTKGIYFGTINYEELFNWMKNIPCKYLLSFDGKRGDIDNTYNVPKELYSSHEYIKSGRSSFKDLKTQEVQYVEESLYIR